MPLQSEPNQPRTTNPFQAAPYGDWFFTYDSLLDQATVRDVEAGADRLVRQARAALPLHPSGVVPIANGHDHFPPQAGIGDVIRRANQMQGDIAFVHGDCGDLVYRVRGSGVQLPVFQGELWGAAFQLILTGTLSTRTDIKQANFAAESLLQCYAEPLCAIASLQGAPYPETLMEEAWRFLLTNHAHDGIHGSSADAVHVEMHQRFLAVRQIAVGLSHSALAYLGAMLAAGSAAEGTRLVAYNPVDAVAREVPLEAWVEADPLAPAAELHVTAADGSTCPTQTVEDPPPRPDTGSPRTGMPWPQEGARHLLFLAEVPARGLRTFTVTKGLAGSPAIEAGDGLIDNGLLRVRFANGAFEVQDKASGATYRGVGVVEEEADAGDAWDFSPPRGGVAALKTDSFSPTCRLVESGPVRATLEAELEMQVPARLEGDQRSARTVALPVRIRVSLWRGIGRADLSIELDNTARDHRLRLRLDTGIVSSTVMSQGHFAILERPLDAKVRGDGWKQPVPRAHHFREWVAVEDARRALAVAARGLYEYEARSDPGGVTLWVTLLRGIGCMGRRNLVTREEPASPPVPTPDAQCLGPHRFELSIVPCSEAGPARRSMISATAAGFLYPPMVHTLYARPVKGRSSSGGGKNADVEPAFFALEPANLRVSAWKRAEDGNGCIVRFWENEGKATKATIRLSPRFRRVVLSGLDERSTRDLAIRDGQVTIDVEAYKIITLRLV